MTLTFAGLPLGRWHFALRTWLAIHLALGVAFWVQLDGAASAGSLAAMLSLQTRGQTFEKAVCCFLGTVVGGMMAIAIVGLFAQARDLYVFAYSAWLAVCVFAAGFLDGNRAYGAVVCGYTVSIVAVARIDDPSFVFSEVINRCAAIVIGVASITLIVDLLPGPSAVPGLLDRMGQGCRTVRTFVGTLLRDGPDGQTDRQAADLLCNASNQHVMLNALPAETLSGSAQAGAIRTAWAALAGAIVAARALAVARATPDGAATARQNDLVAQRLTGQVEAMQKAAAAALAAARDGRPLPNAPRMPIYRSRENALRNALRAFVASALTGFLLAMTGWSDTAFAWAMVGVVICLSSNAPDPAAMTKGALIGLPTAVILGGVTKFVILDGVDAFPLLMLGTAPALLAALLAASSPRPALAGTGLLTAVYTVIVLSPGNPQSYDPQSYLVMAVLLVLVALLAFVLVRILFPTTDAHRRRWALASARRAMHAALRGTGPVRAAGEWRLLDASRIGTLASLGTARPGDMAVALRMADLAGVARRIRAAVEAGRNGPGSLSRALGQNALRALSSADADGLRRASAALLGAGDDVHLPLAADMAWAASLIDGPAELPTRELPAR